jgi:hypothetical protein
MTDTQVDVLPPYIEFYGQGKTPRLFRDIIITEKIDGTNSSIRILPTSDYSPLQGTSTVYLNGEKYYVHAQSRNRLIRVGDDNFGFAAWVWNNADALADILGPGTHFGEWWGKGIRRGYAADGKRFSLFNAHRWENLDTVVGEIPVRAVPVLYQGMFSEDAILDALGELRHFGSKAEHAFPNPEGICIYHTQSKRTYKVTLDNNDKGKWETA